MPTLELNATPTTTHTVTTSWANVAGYSHTFTPASGSLVLLMAVVPMTIDAADNSWYCRFARGGARIGPEIGSGYSDTTDEGSFHYICYVDDAHGGASATYTVQMYAEANDAVDTGRNGMFVIIEFASDEANLHDTGDLTSTTTDSTGSFANITGMSVTYTPTANSVNLLMANCPMDQAGDSTINFQFGIASTAVGYGEDQFYTDLWDSGVPDYDISHGFSFLAVGDQGASSTTFSYMWQTNSGTAGSLDGTLNRNLQCLELLNATLQHDANTTGGTSFGAEQTPTGGSTTETIEGTGSVNIFNITGFGDTTTGAADSTADVQFAMGGTPVTEGPKATTWWRDLDTPLEGASAGLIWANDNLSGSQTFAVRHTSRVGGGADKAARFQIVECKTTTVNNLYVPTRHPARRNMMIAR